MFLALKYVKRLCPSQLKYINSFFYIHFLYLASTQSKGRHRISLPLFSPRDLIIQARRNHVQNKMWQSCGTAGFPKQAKNVQGFKGEIGNVLGRKSHHGLHLVEEIAQIKNCWKLHMTSAPEKYTGLSSSYLSLPHVWFSDCDKQSLGLMQCGYCYRVFLWLLWPSQTSVFQFYSYSY